MKAIDIIDAMIYDSNLAALSGTMYFNYEDGGPVRWAKEKFGARIVKDNGLYCGFKHLYLYEVDVHQSGLQWFIDKYAPDARLWDFNEQEIYLWRID